MEWRKACHCRYNSSHRGLGLVESDGVALNHGIENTESSSDARFSRPSDNFPQESVGLRRRVGKPEPRRETVSSGHQRLRHPKVSRIDNADGSGRVDFRLFSQNEGWNLIVFLRPILQQLPSEAVIQG